MPSVARKAGGHSTPTLTPAQARFRRVLLRWAATHGRHFFWRQPGVPVFEILVTEVLLTRTRAEAVEPVAKRLLATYPDAAALADAATDDVRNILYPLGLFRKRARALVACARALVEDHQGRVPRDVGALLRLPYVGRYAACAVTCFAFGARQAVIDANAARVYGRAFGLPAPPMDLATADDLWGFGQQLVPLRRRREFNWAVLDLGGTICTARSPACSSCPLADVCRAHAQGTCGCRPIARVADPVGEAPPQPRVRQPARRRPDVGRIGMRSS